MIKKGRVYKVHSDSYVVDIDGISTVCTARGTLKKKNDGILVGDYVDIVENRVIEAVENRFNRFRRPNVANVDVVAVVLSPKPKPDFYMIDKLLINSVKEAVEVIIVVNKSDLDDKLFDKVKSEYAESGVKVISVCAKTGDGIPELKSLLKDKLTVLAGQSAAGKTSIVNAIFGLNLKTGDLSDKISRGKHTTTRSEIFCFGDFKIIDSPGFAVIDAAVEPDELSDCYPEYANVANLCRFRGCSHVSEPDCEVKKRVESGIFSKERYERYSEIYKELSKRRIKYEKN